MAVVNRQHRRRHEALISSLAPASVALRIATHSRTDAAVSSARAFRIAMLGQAPVPRPRIVDVHETNPTKKTL
jgi:hypothetical protein